MGYMSLMISQCYPVGFGYILYICRMRKTLLIRFWCAIQVGKKFPHWLEGSVKWYGTHVPTAHNMVVSAYEFALVRMSTQVADLTTKSR
jgi:hypothetical protein